ncbi:family 43 glycosylhydrolase [Dactylosporangium aurantiacum]|uniref:Family 43 glycosylhydrolase n=1 Tax=Dactylosporangium aurantiacum TaxID=35754 RepID=A0A9Q9MB20_9ACTN|nr:family 43 glycosylhydrolase [Dactylosporangium aurantiacum]MDG6101742.1 family 43 glycosylhydrolase [Dactylosporangium aurantiacum]UWZ52448.1 family 43 glycosylhydrolase [Dactylosporangium aurantiacum]
MRRRLTAALTTLAALAAAAVALVLTPAAAAASPAVQYTNPLVNQRADSQIVRHTDGYYYFTATVPEYDRIVLRRATTLQGLATAAETVIWRKHASGVMGAHIWAPEIHYIDGKWYVYFAAGATDNVWAIRMYVLEGTGANPLTATWTEKGRITTAWDTFALDASTFVAGGVRYLVWAQSEPGIATNSNVYIAGMANPWTITGTPVRIATPTLDWERRGYAVNEGPTVIQRNGRIFLTYSASATDANYCLGLLTASASANLLSAASWVKSPNPVFVSNAATGQYGPGHNSFTVSEDGQSDILVYHDRSYRDISGDPLNDPNRRTRVQKLYWNADGTPNFGIPVPDGITPVRLQSYSVPGGFVRHYNYRGRVEANVSPLADAQFRIVTGLGGGGTVSLESTNFPGYYLRHRNFEVWVERNDGSAGFKADASFFRRAGLASGTAVSFESQNYPGRYVRTSGGLLYVQAVSDAAGRADATFTLD